MRQVLANWIYSDEHDLDEFMIIAGAKDKKLFLDEFKSLYNS